MIDTERRYVLISSFKLGADVKLRSGNGKVKEMHTGVAIYLYNFWGEWLVIELLANIAVHFALHFLLGIVAYLATE